VSSWGPVPKKIHATPPCFGRRCLGAEQINRAEGTGRGLQKKKKLWDSLGSHEGGAIGTLSTMGSVRSQEQKTGSKGKGFSQKNSSKKDSIGNSSRKTHVRQKSKRVHGKGEGREGRGTLQPKELASAGLLGHKKGKNSKKSIVTKTDKQAHNRGGQGRVISGEKLNYVYSVVEGRSPWVL